MALFVFVGLEPTALLLRAISSRSSSRPLEATRYGAQRIGNAFCGPETFLHVAAIILSGCLSHMDSYFCTILIKSGFHSSYFSLNCIGSVHRFPIYQHLSASSCDASQDSILLIWEPSKFAKRYCCFQILCRVFVRLRLVNLRIEPRLPNRLLPSFFLKFAFFSLNCLPSSKWNAVSELLPLHLGQRGAWKLPLELFARCSLLYALGITSFTYVKLTHRWHDSTTDCGAWIF